MDDLKVGLAALRSGIKRLRAIGHDPDELDRICALADAVERMQKLERPLRIWASLAKAMGLHLRRNGKLSDYDDELASDVYEAAQVTLMWRDGNAEWLNFRYRNEPHS